MAAAAIGAGLVLSYYGRQKANEQQADAEEANAQFYREQAAYAKKVGERQQDIFERDSLILYGEQTSAFAKAGVDSSSSSLFMAKQMLYRQAESQAIVDEADMNAHLATLRAKASESTARNLRDPMNNLLISGGQGLSAFGGMA